VEPLNLHIASEEEEERSTTPQKAQISVPPRPIELSDPGLMMSIQYTPVNMNGGYEEQIIAKSPNWKKESSEFEMGEDEERRNESFQQEKGIKDDRLLSHHIISDGLHITDDFDDDGDLNDSVDLFLEEEDEAHLHAMPYNNVTSSSLSSIPLSSTAAMHPTYLSIVQPSENN